MHYLLTRASIMVRSGSGVQGPFADVHEMYLEISIVKEQSCHRKLLPVLFLPYVATCRRERKSLHRRVANSERSDVAPCCRLQLTAFHDLAARLSPHEKEQLLMGHSYSGLLHQATNGKSYSQVCSLRGAE
jgi:hypothetical protein